MQGGRPGPEDVPTVEGAERATVYTVNLDAPMHEWVRVELTCLAGGGPYKPPTDTWAVRKGGLCLDEDDDWIAEPIPSSRDAEFYATSRWQLGSALRRARRVARREALWRQDAR